MINTYMYLKFEAKISNGIEVVASTNNFKFKGQLDLEGQGQDHQFSNTSEISMNSLSVKV